MDMVDEDRDPEEMYVEAVDEAEAFEEAAAEFPEGSDHLLLEAAEAWLLDTRWWSWLPRLSRSG